MRILNGLVFTVGLATLTGVAAPEGAFATSVGEGVAAQPHGIMIPYINPARGRALFASKGCVVCHSINGVGGEDAPALDAAEMPGIMNPFEFAARMWRGAGTMIQMQEDELGEQIELNGSELLDIIAFAHDIDEQKKFTEADIPANIAKLMGHLGNETPAHEEKEHN